MDRQEVYKLIDGERDYQNERWGSEMETYQQHDKEHSVAEWITFVRYHLRKAEEEIYLLQPRAALDQIRKIAGLTVACMENNDTISRGEDPYAQIFTLEENTKLENMETTAGNTGAEI